MRCQRGCCNPCTWPYFVLLSLDTVTTPIRIYTMVKLIYIHFSYPWPFPLAIHEAEQHPPHLSCRRYRDLLNHEKYREYTFSDTIINTEQLNIWAQARDRFPNEFKDAMQQNCRCQEQLTIDLTWPGQWFDLGQRWVNVKFEATLCSLRRGRSTANADDSAK
jgi:hypothetical protein